MPDPRSTALAFAVNLQRLMDHHALSQAQLGAKTGIGQSTLSKLLNTERPLEINPRASTVAALADYFRVPPWLLLVPDLPMELLVDYRFGPLIENYARAPEEGRRTILRVAEGEARYAARADEPRTGTGG